MNKIKSQIIHNLKKDKGAYISFGIVILFTALMLNLAFVLVFQVDNAYNEKFTKLNTATMNICISKMQDIDQLSQDLEEIEGVGDANVIVCETEDGKKNVVVVCEGAKNLLVVMNVREAVAAALGTEQNAVKVYQKK